MIVTVKSFYACQTNNEMYSIPAHPFNIADEVFFTRGETNLNFRYSNTLYINKRINECILLHKECRMF